MPSRPVAFCENDQRETFPAVQIFDNANTFSADSSHGKGGKISKLTLTLRAKYVEPKTPCGTKLTANPIIALEAVVRDRGHQRVEKPSEA